jgi:hypothetical protein
MILARLGWILAGAVALLGACANTGDAGPARTAGENTAEPTPNGPETTPTPAPTAPESSVASGESADYGKYYGSCKKDSTKHCSDSYCKGPQCDQLMSGVRQKCDASFSETQCPTGATSICLMPTDIGGNVVNAVNHYYDGEDHGPSCKAFGAKMLKP